jgi:hypothetical protein
MHSEFAALPEISKRFVSRMILSGFIKAVSYTELQPFPIELCSTSTLALKKGERILLAFIVAHSALLELSEILTKPWDA